MDAYENKFKKLQEFIPFLNKMIQKVVYVFNNLPKGEFNDSKDRVHMMTVSHTKDGKKGPSIFLLYFKM